MTTAPSSPSPAARASASTRTVGTAAVNTGVLSSANGESFSFDQHGGGITASAPAGNTDGNIREVFWRSGAAFGSDEQTCATWNDDATSVGSPGGNRQMGLALRIAPATGNGRGIKAVTLTQNIWAGVTWAFWMNVWSVVDPTNTQFQALHEFDVAPIIGFGPTAVPPPWHVCARVVGLTFSFKVWTGTNPEPSWTDATHVFTASLPAGWDYPGDAGAYVGHLRSTESARFSGLSTRTLPVTATGRNSDVSAGRAAPVATPDFAWPTYVG
ncbi:MAG: hypothetical protein JST73_02670 [Actinobacteria bacterium]|nr:hypothetical protein [Actinomycetota bacterium]